MNEWNLGGRRERKKNESFERVMRIRVMIKKEFERKRDGKIFRKKIKIFKEIRRRMEMKRD